MIGIPPALRARARTPLLVMVACLLLLGTNILLGALDPHGLIWIVEVVITVTMIVIILLFSMEILEQPGITRLFGGLGFFWVAILFSLTLVDYLNR
jgi:cytochrome c oxidase subunit 4